VSREEFIQILKDNRYSYEIEGDKIIVTDDEHVYLDALTSLPPGVEFKNRGSVYLDALTSLHPGVEFENKGAVYLDALTSLHPGVEFKKRGSVYLDALTGDWFIYWKGNIEGINNKRLLNKMIKKGVFI
jgi:hypothetical protein